MASGSQSRGVKQPLIPAMARTTIMATEVTWASVRTTVAISMPSPVAEADVAKTIKLEGENVRPMGVAVAPDGKHVYVTTGHGSSVVVIDTAKDEVTASIPVGRRAWGIAISPDGKTLYTANGFTDDVSVVDTATNKETAKIKVGTKPWGIVIVP